MGQAQGLPLHKAMKLLIYDGSMVFLGGTADAAVVSALLSNERLVPLLEANDRALTAVWVCDFTKANLGPHHELQLSLFATFRPLQRLNPHPFTIFRWPESEGT